MTYPSRRARYARTNQPYGNLLVNNPAGFPSSFPPGVPVSSSLVPGSPVGGGPEILWWWGDDSPLLATHHSAANMSAVTRATSLIANTIAALPFRALTGGPTISTSTVELPPPRWVTDPQLHRPDRRFGEAPPEASSLRLTKSLFWAEFIRSALLKGMGYLVFEETAIGEPIAGTLRLLNPDMVAPQEDENGNIVRRIGSVRSGLYVDTARDGSLMLGSRRYRMVELNNPLDSPDQYGMTRGVIAMHLSEFTLAAQAINYARGMFKSGIPSGYLKSSIPNYSREQAQKLKAAWLEEHGGDARSVAVLNATTDYVPISLGPVDMALIQSRQMSLVDIANAFGVPSYMLGGSDGSSNTYSNAESRNSDFRQFSLAPWAIAFEEILTSLTVAGSFIVVDFRGLLRPDTSTRYGAYAQALSAGWLTVDEVRQLENLPELPKQQPQLPPAPPDQDQPSIDPEGTPPNVEA